jgi:hypothetical protein
MFTDLFELFFDEGSLRKALNEYLAHYHMDRNHQGKENVLLFPTSEHGIRKRNGRVNTTEKIS